MMPIIACGSAPAHLLLRTFPAFCTLEFGNLKYGARSGTGTKKPGRIAPGFGNDAADFRNLHRREEEYRSVNIFVYFPQADIRVHMAVDILFRKHVEVAAKAIAIAFLVLATLPGIIVWLLH